MPLNHNYLSLDAQQILNSPLNVKIYCIWLKSGPWSACTDLHLSKALPFCSKTLCLSEECTSNHHSDWKEWGSGGGDSLTQFKQKNTIFTKEKKPSSWKQVCLGCKLYLAWYVQPQIIWIWCVLLNCEQWKYSQNQQARVYDLLMLSGASLSYKSNTSTLFCGSINKNFIQHAAIHPFFNHRLQCRVAVPGLIPVVSGWKWGHTQDKAPVYCRAGTDR